MKPFLLLILFIIGVVVGMVIIPLLPDGVQRGISSFQLEIRYQVGLEERLGEMPLSSTPTPRPGETASLLSTSTPTPIPLPRIRVSPLHTPTPTPSSLPRVVVVPLPTSTPTPPPTAAIEDLRQLALDIINRDRADHGLPPVVLGSNVAAQHHANDMLEHNYQGHWWADGSKPYMVYTRTSGRSYVAENVASSGWTDREWEMDSCGSLFVRCSVPEPAEAVIELQYLMMYDDAHADWGHRDNILRESHRAVNIGIASNGRRVTFVQHFEGGAALAQGPPELSRENILSFSMDKEEDGIQVGGVVSIYYDPPPISMTPQAIDALDSYCLGGGATTQCGDEVVTILEPPGAGYFYTDLQPNEIVAQSWLETSDYFILGADVGNLMQKPGVYTVIVWQDAGGIWLEEVLIELSVFVE